MSGGVDRLLCLAWNQTRECFAAGSEVGFVIVNVTPFRQLVRRDVGGVGLIKMYNRTNMLALVGAGRNPVGPPNRVLIWDDAKQRTKFELEFKTPVLNIELCRNRLIVVLQTKVFVYSWAVDDKPPVLLEKFLYDTAENYNGAFALFSSERSTMMAFPARQSGFLHIVDIAQLSPRETISVLFPAHKHRITHIAFSSSGQFVATASSQGTLIRVFATSKGKQLFEFRRSRIAATICSVAFNARDTKMSVISSTGTVHVFALGVAPADQSALPARSTSATAPRAGTTTSASAVTVAEEQPTSFLSQIIAGSGIKSEMEFPTPMCDFGLVAFASVLAPSAASSIPSVSAYAVPTAPGSSLAAPTATENAAHAVTCVLAVCDNCTFYAFPFNERGAVGSRTDLPLLFHRFYKPELSVLPRLFPKGVDSIPSAAPQAAAAEATTEAATTTATTTRAVGAS
eukprot:m.716483 g.716483  ORF g.716483 m.716483 type:complete len:456 (-) comp58795_c0_seq1:149-1516(-)